MKQISSSTFFHHNATYEIVKYDVVDNAKWVVYTYSINGRGAKLFEFTDVRFSPNQAEHVARHMIRMYEAGKDAGRTEYRNKIYDIIHN